MEGHGMAEKVDGYGRIILLTTYLTEHPGFG